MRSRTLSPLERAIEAKDIKDTMKIKHVYAFVVALEGFGAATVEGFVTKSRARYLNEFALHLQAEHLATPTPGTTTSDPTRFINRSFEDGSPVSLRKAVGLPSADYSQPFPFGLIEGEAELKQALLLAACNPRIGGVVIYGRRGSGKSCLARAMHRLMPSHITRVKNSPYNVDPNDSRAVDSLLRASLLQSGRKLQDLKTESIPTPFVTVPVNVMEDSLLGTVDLEASMETGQTIFSPGLLARAHRGVLQVDDINLMDESTLYVLFQVLADGYARVEREGTSVEYPCRPLLLATFNPAEGDLSEHLLDRIAIALSTNTESLSTEERVHAVMNVEGYREKNMSLEAIGKDEERLRDSVANAQKLLPKVEINHAQMVYLCQEATRARCEGQRAEIFATEIAKTNAALDGRTHIEAKDLELGVLLAIAPRSHFSEEQSDEACDEEPSPPSAQQKNPQDVQSSFAPSPDQPESDMQREEERESEGDESNETPEEEEEEKEEVEIPLQFMFGVDPTQLDPRILRFQKWGRKGKGGKASRMFNLQCGRFVKAIFPKGDWKQCRIAVGATLRAAAPYQKVRRRCSLQDKLVYIRKDDFRIKRMAKKAGVLVIFVVDSSGSMALNRMGAAKGAAMSLLTEAYKSRDKICLITFNGNRAEVQVPPTKSIALTKNRLEEMPCGGGSPLAHALTTAVRTGLNEMKVKRDVGRVVVVLLTDGRANVSLGVSEGDEPAGGVAASRSDLKAEVLAIAKKLGSIKDFNVLVIDSEDRYVGTGMARAVALASQGIYHQLVQHTDNASLATLAMDVVEASRL